MPKIRGASDIKFNDKAKYWAKKGYGKLYFVAIATMEEEKKRTIDAIRTNIHFYFPYLRTVYLHSIQRSRLTSTTKYKNNLSK